jgi:hypothetical protein
MSEPLTGEKVALLQQDYLRLLIASDEMFNNVTVIAEDEGNIISEMDKALGIVTTRDGARGACVIIRQPNGSDEMPGVLFPPLDLEWDILCLEHREFNKDTTKGGTGKRAWHLARRIQRICKAHRAPGLIQCLMPRKPGIARASVTREINGVEVPLVGYIVRLSGKEADNTAYSKATLPAVTGDPALTNGTILSGTGGTTLTVAADPGAAVYYTSDLTNPCSENSAATLYTIPFAPAAGTYLFRAHVTGKVGSDSVAVKIS